VRRSTVLGTSSASRGRIEACKVGARVGARVIPLSYGQLGCPIVVRRSVFGQVTWSRIVLATRGGELTCAPSVCAIDFEQVGCVGIGGPDRTRRARQPKNGWVGSISSSSPASPSVRATISEQRNSDRIGPRHRFRAAQLPLDRSTPPLPGSETQIESVDATVSEQLSCLSTGRRHRFGAAKLSSNRSAAPLPSSETQIHWSASPLAGGKTQIDRLAPPFPSSKPLKNDGPGIPFSRQAWRREAEAKPSSPPIALGYPAGQGVPIEDSRPSRDHIHPQRMNGPRSFASFRVETLRLDPARVSTGHRSTGRPRQHG
jgi:hypothetical protein